MDLKLKNKIINDSSILVHDKWLERYKNKENNKFMKDISIYLGLFIGILFGGYYGCIYNSIIITGIIVYSFINSIEKYPYVFDNHIFYFPMNLMKINDKITLELLDCIIDIEKLEKDEYLFISEEKYEYYLSTRQVYKEENHDYESYKRIYCNKQLKGFYYPIKYNVNKKEFQTDIAIPWREKTQVENKSDMYMNKEINIYMILSILYFFLIYFINLNFLFVLQCIGIFLFYYYKYKPRVNKTYKICTLLPQQKKLYKDLCFECLDFILKLKEKKNVGRYSILNNEELKSYMLSTYLKLNPQERYRCSEIEYAYIPNEYKLFLESVIESICYNLFKINT